MKADETPRLASQTVLALYLPVHSRLCGGHRPDGVPAMTAFIVAAIVLAIWLTVFAGILTLRLAHVLVHEVPEREPLDHQSVMLQNSEPPGRDELRGRFLKVLPPPVVGM